MPDVWAHHSSMDDYTSFILDHGPISMTRAIRQFGMALRKEPPHFINAGIGYQVQVDDDGSNVTSLVLPNKFLNQKEMMVDMAGEPGGAGLSRLGRVE